METTMTKKVCYVHARAGDDQYLEDFQTIRKDLDFDITIVKSLTDLFFLLNDNTTIVDVIIFQLPTLFTNEECDVYGIISTIDALSACARPSCRRPSVSVIIDINSTVNQLQSLSGTDIKGVIPCSKWKGIDATVIALQEILMGHTYLPKTLLDSSNSQKRNLQSNEIKLTPRQTQILKLICNRGAPNKTIARMMDISESTVKLHVTAILKKFGVRNRTQLALFAADSIR